METFQVIRDNDGHVLNFPGLDPHDRHSIVSHWPDAEVQRLADQDSADAEGAERNWLTFRDTD